MKISKKYRIVFSTLIVIVIVVAFGFYKYNLLDYFELKSNVVEVNNQSYETNYNVKWVGSLLNKNYGSKTPFDTLLISNSIGNHNIIPNSYGETQFVIEFKDTIIVKPNPFKRKAWIKNKYKISINGFDKKSLDVKIKIE